MLSVDARRGGAALVVLVLGDVIFALNTVLAESLLIT
jgi:hypothetical protein